MERLIVFDTTLRDGEQSAGAGLTTDEKRRIARQLERLGVDVVEAGFAHSSPGDFETIKLIGRDLKDTVTCSLARALAPDIESAAEALKGAHRPRIHTFISSSELHLLHQMRRGQEEVLNIAVEAVKLARRHTDDVEFSPMDASRTEPSFLHAMLEAVIKAGATTVNIPDTVGYSVSSEFAAAVRGVLENVPNIHKAVVSVHCHNDLGMAVGNTVAAIEAGARQVEGCINGLGERAGNAALEEVVMAIKTRRAHFNLSTSIRTEELGPTSRLVSSIFGFPVQYNKAIVGKNAFRHSSGIHQDGYLKNRSTFEIMEPDQVGWQGEAIVLGKLSGRAGLRMRLADLGYELEEDELSALFKEFKVLADSKSEVNENDLHTLVAAHYRRQDVRKSYRLDNLKVVTATNHNTQAEIALHTPSGKVERAIDSTAGPVEALFAGINEIVGSKFKLEQFSITAVSHGRDALGEANVRISNNGHFYSGKGADIDILVASTKAYLNAINRHCALRDKHEAGG